MWSRDRLRTDQRQQLVDGHGSLLRLQVRHVVLNHLVCDPLRKLLTQLFDPETHCKVRATAGTDSTEE